MVRSILSTIFFFLSIIRLYAQAPTISSVSPLSGPVGTTVTITGSNFDAAAANNIVYFGGTRATVTSATGTTLTVLVPHGTTHQPVTVINTATGLQRTTRSAFIPTFNEANQKSFTTNSFSQITKHDSHGGFEVFLQSVDIDHDGKLDLVTVNTYDETINIYHNKSVSGALTENSLILSATIDLSPASELIDVQESKFADVDGDGLLDMIVPLRMLNKVAVYKNSSASGIINNQSFAGRVEFTTGNTPEAVAVADLNNDGKPEIIAANNVGSNISVLTNTTTKGTVNAGSFAPKQDYTSGWGAQSVEAGDLDGDGKIDLVVGTGSGFDILNNTTATGSATYSFTRTSKYEMESTGSYVNLADLNSDGLLDIICVPPAKNVGVYKNTSTPSSISFASRYSLVSGSFVNSIAVADINGDSKPDIVTAPNGGAFTVIPNRSEATLSFGVEVALPASASDFSWVVAADFDGDGRADIIGTDGYSKISLIRNKIIGLPVIESFTPASGKTGDTIVVSGKNLATATSVTFGGTNALSFKVVSDTEITAVVNKGTSGDISVLTADGPGSKAGFTYIPPPPPVISSFVPAAAAVGQSINIRGENFKGVSSVSFGGTPAKSFVVNSPTNITAVLNTGSSGDVTVVTVDGTSSRTGFTFLRLPTITSFSPFSAAKGQVVTIDGTNLTGTTRVTFNGFDAASFTVVSPTRITAVVGEGETGYISVTTPHGHFQTGSSVLPAFYFTGPPPQVTDFSPIAAAPGSIVTITGNNFSLVPDYNYVYFGATRAKILHASLTELQVQVPAGATYSPIVVHVNGRGTAYSKKFFSLIYSPNEVITAATFGNKFSLWMGNDIRSMSVGDVQDDGKPDIVFAAHGNYYPTIAVNSGTPGIINFQYKSLRTQANETDQPIDVAILPGEKRPLLVLIDKAYDIYTNMFRRNSNQGDFSYSKEGLRWRGDGYATNVAVADMDGDGSIDQIIGGLGFVNVMIADIDGDGKPDVVQRNTNTISVFRNTSMPGTIAYADKVDFPVDGKPLDVVAGDFDGDSMSDLAVVCLDASGVSGSVSIFQNASSPGLISINKIAGMTIAGKPGKAAAGDINGDGKLELAVSNGNKVSVYSNQSSETETVFGDPVEFNINGNMGVAICDFDGDKRPDLAGVSDSFLEVMRFVVQYPVIAAATPLKALEGSTVTIEGSNFTGVSAVTFGGTAARSFEVVSPTKIVAVVDQGSSGEITVTSPSGTGNLQGFEYLITPVIYAGGPTTFSGGGNVMLRTDSIPGATYQWLKDGAEIPDATAITYKANKSGAYVVSVTLNGITQSSAATTVTVNPLPAPIINYFTPTTAAEGSTIMINGHYFEEVTEVRLGGVPVESFTIEYGTIIRAVVPKGASGEVSVISDAGTGIKAGFVHVPRPVITANGSTTIYRGSSVTLTSSTGSDYTYQWKFNGVDMYMSTGSTARAYETGLYSVAITSKGITATSDPVQVTVLPVASISTLSPYTAKAGTKVAIKGYDLDGASAVTFGGVPASSFTIVSGEQIDAIVGEGASGEVVVTTPAGIARKSGFNYFPVPTVTSNGPTTFYAGGSVLLKATPATGYGYQWKKDGVNIAGATSANYTVTASGSYTVTISLSGITTTSAATVVDVVPVPSPSLSSVSPLSAGYGETVTISGANFTGVTNVSFGGTPASSFTVVSPTTITAIVGAGTSGKISVTTAGGTAEFPGFSYTPPMFRLVVSKVTNGAEANTSPAFKFGFQDGATSTAPTTVAFSLSGTATEGADYNTVPKVIVIPAGSNTVTLNITVVDDQIIEGNETLILSVTGVTNTEGTVEVSAPGVTADIIDNETTGLSSTLTLTKVSDGAEPSTDVRFQVSYPPGVTCNNATTVTYTVDGTATPGADHNGATGTLYMPAGTNAFTFSIPVIDDAIGEPSETVTLTLIGVSNSIAPVNFASTPVSAQITDNDILSHSITSITPLTGKKGTVVTITGSGFSGVSSVSFGGTPAASFTVVSPTTITATISTGSTGDVSVITPSGSALIGGFRFVPVPTITADGPTTFVSGGQVGLSASPAGPGYGYQWQKNGVDIAGATGQALFTPEGGTYTVRISLNGVSEVSLPTTVTVLPAPFPTIDAISPSAAKAGDVVTITGSNFTGASSVTFSGIPAASFNVVSSTTITAVVGNGATGVISVTTPSGITIFNGFVFVPPPAISAISPSTAKAGDMVTITGSGFSGVSSVTFGGTPAASFTVVSPTTITATISTGSTGDVSVITPSGSALIGGFRFVPVPTITADGPTTFVSGGQVGLSASPAGPGYGYQWQKNGVDIAGATGQALFTPEGGIYTVRISLNGVSEVSLPTTVTVLPAPFPVIDAVSPSTAKAGDVVTITGTNLAQATEVTFGGTAAASFSVVSSTMIKAVVGSGTTGQVTVKAPAGTASKDGFSFVFKPQIVSNGQTTFNEGGSIMLTAATGLGWEFQWKKDGINIPGATEANFNATESGAYTVSISRNGVTETSLPTVVTVVPLMLPTVSSISPSTAVTGDVVTITGSNLGDATEVFFNNVPAASFTVISASRITATVGKGESGTVIVRTPKTTAGILGFTFVPKPAIVAGGPTDFMSGGSVHLAAIPSSGYSYQWKKNGVDIPGATGSGYTATESGSYAVSIILNNVPATSEAVSVNSVFTLPSGNFKVTASSASCRGANNGALKIEATRALDYTATFSGDGVNATHKFSDVLNLDNLKPGTYDVCITVGGQPSYQQCYQIQIKEPKELAAYTAYVNEREVVITLEGATMYYIELNGKIYSTSANQIILPLTAGDNVIKVTSDKECQGMIEKTISLAGEPTVYPNPFDQELTLELTREYSNAVTVSVYSLNGTEVFAAKYRNISKVKLNLLHLVSGAYMLKVSGPHSEKVFRIIKK